MLKVLIRNKNTIQKGDKGNKVVITDKEKYTEGVKKAISEYDKFFQLNITPHKCVNYIIILEQKLKQLFKNLLDNDKTSMRSMIKFVLKLLDQEYLLPILKSIKRLLTTCQNFD